MGLLSAVTAAHVCPEDFLVAELHCIPYASVGNPNRIPVSPIRTWMEPIFSLSVPDYVGGIVCPGKLS